ncbi:U1 small nuclear ribonucleoprotein 70 kDa-like [Populus alba x Populus x berolinensis]|uniref:U1 small nuclear ribonucleoprotein 70 kDa n=1 Tax=Populus alba x Populus x berolinensis TaxID=444605 RepID=A0AAD6W2X8_9ROSI|nr:U1 small nuclear ribonucleoprotein 70 kDa-like [Populus alba x Populus x berolinensis]
MGDNNDAFMRNQNAAVRGTTKGQNRANVLQLKLIGQSHPTGLTTNLLKLFEPRLPLEFKPPPEKRKCPPYSGMAQFVSNFAEPGDLEYAPPIKEAETRSQRKARIHMARLEKGAEKAAEELQKYDPNNDPKLSGDPYKTLFVARLSYETTESKIKRELESYGPIKQRLSKHIRSWEDVLIFRILSITIFYLKQFIPCFSATLALVVMHLAIRSPMSKDLQVCMVADKVSNKPRGYAFIEYMHTRDMKAAYKQADGRKLDGRRVLVDVERGRTVPNWRPRRLGGGLGTTRVGGEEVNQRHPGREVQQSGGLSRSEEPRTREDRHTEREREVSRDRGRDKDKEREREKSHERSHDRPRDRDHREDRHNRDRERERDRGRDRDRTRDRGRDRGRDYERDRERDHGRDRARDRERDYEVGDHYHGRSHDRDESKHERDRHGERDNDHAEPEDDMGWYEQPEQGQKLPDAEDDQHYDHYEHRRSRGRYDHMDVQGDHGRSDLYHGTNRDGDHMEEDDYHYDRGTSESRENRRLERSPSQD